MELEEMKNAWLALSEKLDKKEKLGDLLIREMYQTKVKKALNVLLGYECIGVASCLFILPFLAWRITLVTDHSLFWFMLVYWAVFDAALIIWQLVKINCLVKLDTLKNVKENLLSINSYKALITKEKWYASLLGVIGMIPFFFIFLKITNSLWRWTFMFSMLLFVLLLSIWSYKRIYGRNIRSIQQNLEELEELEE